LRPARKSDGSRAPWGGLDALEADVSVRQALPDEMFTVFMHYKRDEWERFIGTVTEWDVKEYLDILP
jgi:glutamine synthetase